MAGSIANLLLRIISQKGDASSDVEQLAASLEALDHSSAEATASVDTDQLSFDALVTELEAFDKKKYQAKVDAKADFSQLELFTKAIENVQRSRTFDFSSFGSGGDKGGFTKAFQLPQRQLELDLDTKPAENKLHKFEQLFLQVEKQVQRPATNIPLVDLRDIDSRTARTGRAISSMASAFGSLSQAGAGAAKSVGKLGEGFGGVTVNLGMFGLKLGPIVALVLVLVGLIGVSLVTAFAALAASAILAATALGALAVALGAAIVPMLLVALPAILAFGKVLKALQKQQRNAAQAAQEKAQADAQARQYAQSHADAVRALGEATQRSADAQKAAYREMEDAIERVSDSLRAMKQAQLTKEQAALNVEKADLALKKFRQDAGLAGDEFDAMFKTFKDVSFNPAKLNAALADVQGPAASLGDDKKLELKQLILDAKQARLDEKDAIDGVSDSERDHKRAVEDALPFQQQGIDASKTYAAALDGVADAQRRLRRLEANRRFELEQQNITKSAKATAGLTENEKTLLGNVKKLIAAFKYAFGPAGQALIDGFVTGLTGLGDVVKKLRDPLTRLGKAMGGTVANFFKAMSSDDSQKLFKGMIDGATTLAPLIGSVLGSFLSILSKIAIAAMPFLVEGFKDFAKWLGKIDKNTSVKDIRDWLADLIPHLKQWIKLAGKLIPGFFAFLKDIGPEALVFLTWLTGIVEKFKDWAESDKGQKDTKDFFTNMLETAKLFFGILFAIVKFLSLMNDVFGWLREAAGNFFDFIYARAQDVYDFWYAFGAGLSDLKDSLVEKFNGIKDFIGGLPAWFSQAATDIWNGFINGLNSIGDAIWGAIKGVIDSAVQKLKDWLGINSPSTLFYGFGADVITGFINGLRDFAVGLFTPLYDAVVTAINWLGGLPGQFFDLGRSIITGLIDGIKSIGTSVADAVVGKATDAWNAVKGFFHIGSPSKLMMDLGVEVGKGFELGIASTSARVATAATSALAQPVISAAQAGAGAASGVTIQNQTVNLPAAPGHDQMGDPRHQAAQFAREMRRRGRR